jgi:hypothetical protein
VPAPKDFDEMWREWRGMLPKLRTLLRNPFANTPLSATEPGVLEVTGDLRLVNGAVLSSSFDGTDFSHPGTAGNYFGDDGAVLNNTYFRPGSVGNDALANPVEADINGANGAGLSVSTTSTVKATTSLTVPAGFTKALVRADALGEAANSTASDDYLYVDANIQGISGGESYVYTPSGKANGAVGIANRFVTGLSGGDVITCTAMSRTAFAGWAADGVNLWVIHMQVIWLR